MTSSSTWFGRHGVPEDQMIHVLLGSLSLTLARRSGEWRIAWSRVDEAETSSASPVSGPVPITDPEPDHTVQRFPSRRAGKEIELRPRLADRPVVTRPELPIVVPAGDEAQVFVSTPIWVQVELPDPPRVLLEMPAIRPSDTWFGPDTRHGVVAYASRTSARLEAANLESWPHRAITCVTLRNLSEEPLPVERLSVPAPSLELFADPRGNLWTASLLVIKEKEAAPAQVSVESQIPEQAGQAHRVSPPREPEERNVVSRALHVLIG